MIEARCVVNSLKVGVNIKRSGFVGISIDVSPFFHDRELASEFSGYADLKRVARP